jgi:hypothetical protein
MTSQTQKFIEITDILSFRIECKCGATVITPIVGYKEMPLACSNCGHQFADYNDHKIPQLFKDLISDLAKVKLAADHREFSFSLEIQDGASA